MSKITQNTLVPLSLVLSIIYVSYWAGGLEHKVNTAEAAVTQLTVKHEEAIKELKKIGERLAEISGILKRRDK